MSGADERLAVLAARWSLGDGQVGELARLLEFLASEPHAPSTVTDPARAVDVHICDSLNGLAVPDVAAAAAIADLGSGAGFPGLVLAVALPHAHVCLVESSSRKAEFIEHATTAAGIGNAEVVRLRAEEWSPENRLQDVVTARALAPLAVICEYAAPLLRIGGTLVAWTGRRDLEAERAAGMAAQELGLEVRETVRCDPYPGADDHHLTVYMKLKETPSRFPRRAGMARKRPLGGSGRA